MYQRIVLTFLFLAILLCYSQKAKDLSYALLHDEYLSADNIYKKAASASESDEEALNKDALDKFTSLINKIKPGVADSLLFHCYVKTGTLFHYFDSIAPAINNYRQAIDLGQKLANLPDSFLFRPYIYLGGILYTQNQFDSALYYYKKAENIGNRYPVRLSESERLFNTLGALYFETANYQQAKNYFEKAISLLPENDPFYEALLSNYKINLAATHTKLEEYKEAKEIYLGLPASVINSNDVKHNLGFISLRTGDIKEALSYFSQVTYSNKNNVRLYNDLSQAYFQLHQWDSSEFYIQKAFAENTKWNGNQKNIQHGSTFKYHGDLLAEKGLLKESLRQYQQAIIQFDIDFNDSSINKNPENFSGIFSYINLFHALTAKAAAFEALYNKEKKAEYLAASLSAYQAAFSLSDYVERSYDSDEDRLLLNKIKYLVHDKPISISLELYKLTGKEEYMEEAFAFDQRNKASVLSLNINDAALKNKVGIDSSLLSEEALLKSHITRLSLRSGKINDSAQLAMLNSTIRDQQIQLGKIQEKINENSQFSKLRSGQKPLAAKEVQLLLDNETLLLSYHVSTDKLVLFSISKTDISYNIIPVDEKFFTQLLRFRNSLHDISPGEKYAGTSEATSLYSLLIGPVSEKINKMKRLVIIPDDELNYIPFEALQNKDNKYLIESIAIQYQYSSALLRDLSNNKKNKETLAFAPFAANGSAELPALPESNNEINTLKGKILMNEEASKENFIRYANHYGIIHLATHAIVNDSLSDLSMISFYPRQNTESRLFAKEIYDMKLDSTQLIILSACETGTGRLIRGEGLMSLSRAFAYAGCSNIITSMWKANDKTTAFICKKLHEYIDKGYSDDEALQLAKTDLLKSNEIEPALKTPNYWAHLVFIGNYEPKKNLNWAMIVIIAAALLTIIYFLKKQKARLVKARP